MEFRTLFDDLDEATLCEFVSGWLQSPETPRTTLEQTDQAFNLVTPRSVFLKNLPFGSSLLDLGAGDGTLSVYRNWPLYDRFDIKMYALSLMKGIRFDLYDGYELKNFEEAEDLFPGVTLNAIVCAHFIEHMNEPHKTLDLFASRLAPGGCVYLEWPHALSKRMPPRLSLIKNGVNISTTRFDDDDTHVDTWSMEKIISLLQERKMVIETAGRVHFTFLADELRNHGHAQVDIARTTMGLWARVGWAQYLVAFKPRV
jgi:SAM-dependent methyltransferase